MELLRIPAPEVVFKRVHLVARLPTEGITTAEVVEEVLSFWTCEQIAHAHCLRVRNDVVNLVPRYRNSFPRALFDLDLIRKFPKPCLHHNPWSRVAGGHVDTVDVLVPTAIVEQEAHVPLANSPHWPRCAGSEEASLETLPFRFVAALEDVDGEHILRG